MAVSGAPGGLASQRPWTAFSALDVDRATPARRRLATNAERQAECLLINDLISITSITLFEARYGLDVLADGRRKSLLQERFELLVREELDSRILVFDSRAAEQAAELAAARKRLGRPVDIRDAFIAGIAVAHGAMLATRNTRHFADLSVPVVDPWG